MTEPTRLYLDDLREYAVRDLNRLRVGDHVLLVHLPRLDVMTPWDRANPNFHAQDKTIESIGKYTFAELNSNFGLTTQTEPKSAIVFSHERNDYMYATDAGVEPYPAGFFNPSNFILRLEELVRFGISPALELKPTHSQDRQVAALSESEMKERLFDVRKPHINDYVGD